MMRSIIALVVLTAPAVAADEATRPWRDPDTGCAYIVNEQGGVSIRYRRDGLVDCPGANAPAPGMETGSGPSVTDATVRDLVRTIERLQTEVQAIRRELERRR